MSDLVSSPLTALVVDDEELARKLVVNFIGRDPELELLGSCATADEARRVIARRRPDLLFLDIHMPGQSGVELATVLADCEHAPHVIFVTAHDEYAIKAFELDALDYLLKPIDPTRFRQSIARAKTAIRQRRRDAAEPGPDSVTSRTPMRLTIREGDRLISVRFGDIVWVEAASQYVHVHTASRSYTLARSLKVFADELPADRFVRVHRSALVNRRRLRRIRKRRNGVHEIVLDDGTAVPLSRSRKRLVPELLEDCESL